MADSVRVDRWLWAVRGFKTRAQANEACTKGRVRVNGEVCKPATKVRLGDRVEARRKDRVLVYEVAQVLEKRVGAALAADAVVDHSPPVTLPNRDPLEAVAPTRDRGAGRPTKRDRRRIEEFRRR
ncbi:MAG: RNA-binding S4 domain-containing protein [Acidimicrobiales bacterium]